MQASKGYSSGQHNENADACFKEIDELKRVVREVVDKQQQHVISMQASKGYSSGQHNENAETSKRLVLHNEEDLALKVTELSSRLQTTETKLATMETTISKLQSSPTAAGGSTYVRWGRTDCPANGTELVYKGYVGGSMYTETGGGMNYLCLTDTPIYGKVESGRQNYRAYTYGAEYDFGDHSSSSFFVNQRLYNNDVPCAVCLTVRSSVLMIPGTNACTAGWSLEYKGYLSAQYTGYDNSDYVCLDDDPVPVPGTQRDDIGKVFFLAEGRCGSLQCPPYIDGHELTCAVCSK